MLLLTKMVLNTVGGIEKRKFKGSSSEQKDIN